MQGVGSQWMYVCTDGRAQYDASSSCMRSVVQRPEVVECVNRFRAANATTDEER